MLFCVVCSEVSKSFRLYSFAPPSRKIGSSHGGGVRGELILRVEFALARLGDPSKHPTKRIECRVGGAKKSRVVPPGRYLVLPRWAGSHGGGVRGELILRVEFALARLGDPSKHPKKRIERVGGAKKLRVVPLGRYLVLPRGKIMHSFVKEFKYQDRYCGRCVLTH